MAMLPQLRFSGCRPLPSSRAPLRVRAVAEVDAPLQAVSGDRKLGPLQRGGTLAGADAAGKDASEKAKQQLEKTAKKGIVMQITDGKFRDDRWVGGRWDLSQFTGADGATDWDKVIDVEIIRRRLLEETPIPTANDDPVNFDTEEVPWWAWVRRFHLPEAEKLNGRAAMMGYVLALIIDKLTGAGLLEQQNSFLGLVALHITVFAILLIRQSADWDKYKGLLEEATFYDRQWNASWDGVQRPSEKK